MGKRRIEYCFLREDLLRRGKEALSQLIPALLGEDEELSLSLEEEGSSLIVLVEDPSLRGEGELRIYVSAEREPGDTILIPEGEERTLPERLCASLLSSLRMKVILFSDRSESSRKPSLSFDIRPIYSSFGKEREELRRRFLSFLSEYLSALRGRSLALPVLLLGHGEEEALRLAEEDVRDYLAPFAEVVRREG